MNRKEAIQELTTRLNFERNHKCNHPACRRGQLQLMASYVIAIRSMKQSIRYEQIIEYGIADHLYHLRFR